MKDMLKKFRNKVEALVWICGIYINGGPLAVRAMIALAEG